MIDKPTHTIESKTFSSELYELIAKIQNLINLLENDPNTVYENIIVIIEKLEAKIKNIEELKEDERKNLINEINSHPVYKLKNGKKCGVICIPGRNELSELIVDGFNEFDDIQYHSNIENADLIDVDQCVAGKVTIEGKEMIFFGNGYNTINIGGTNRFDQIDVTEWVDYGIPVRGTVTINGVKKQFALIFNKELMAGNDGTEHYFVDNGDAKYTFAILETQDSYLETNENIHESLEEILKVLKEKIDSLGDKDKIVEFLKSIKVENGLYRLKSGLIVGFRWDYNVNDFINNNLNSKTVNISCSQFGPDTNVIVQVRDFDEFQKLINSY